MDHRHPSFDHAKLLLKSLVEWQLATIRTTVLLNASFCCTKIRLHAGAIERNKIASQCLNSFCLPTMQAKPPSKQCNEVHVVLTGITWQHTK